ncbi:chemotaxis protein [Halobacteriales archaeon QS_1_68_17]|nr:MAG: chemotaxis protein [Halobacteriales archaeon QS_1_68_17]
MDGDRTDGTAGPSETGGGVGPVAGGSGGDEESTDGFERTIERYCAVMRAAAEGDLTRRMDPEVGDEATAAFARTYNEMMDELEGTLRTVWSFSGEVEKAGGSVASGASEVEAASERVTESIQEISDRTTDQTRNLTSVSDEMEDISAAIEEVSASASEVAETAREATRRGEEGRESAELAIEEIDRVEAASEEIVENIEALDDQMSEVVRIIDFITDIAEQTNILALNANIEAARATDANGGFAVVAEEVKDLAEETKEAAAEIESVIREARAQTERAVTDIQSTSDSISEGARTVEEALDALTETVEYVEEASEGIQEISSAVNDQANANQEVVASVAEVADLSEEVDDQADSIATAARRQTDSIASISRETSDLRASVTSLEESLTDFAINEWGQRINDHCREAGIDWRQCEGATIRLGLAEGPFPTTTEPLLPFFEELTGIEVEYSVQMEDKLFDQLERDLAAGKGRYDVFQLGMWPAAGYHHNGWVKDLNEFMADASLTDRRWYHVEDYHDSFLDAFTYRGDRVAFPFGIEAAGCVAYDKPTFQKLGLEPPTDFETLRHAAKTIHESDDVDRAGFVSRATADTLSTHNFVAMFKSHSADWLDYRRREATLNAPEGVRALDLYAELLREYGPRDVGSMNWLAANQAYGEGNVGILYHTPQTASVFSDEQFDRTEFLPPLEGPDGDRIAGTSAWALGINAFSDAPDAAWLFLQWATCRPTNLLLSTDQWTGQESFGQARINWLVDQPELDTRGHPESWNAAHTDGFDLIPSDPPPVPLHTPQNMDIMTEVAEAMHSTIVGRTSAQAAFDDAAPRITEHARQIPDAYLR